MMTSRTVTVELHVIADSPEEAIERVSELIETGNQVLGWDLAYSIDRNVTR